MQNQVQNMRVIQGSSLTNKLPGELLTPIAQNLPQKSLLSLGITCRTFHSCVTPLLYRYVYRWETRVYWWYHLSQLDQVMDCIAHLQSNYFMRTRVSVYEPTKIFDLHLFLRTMEESLFLRSQVVAIGLECTNEQLHADGVKLVELIGPSIQFFHLWPLSSRGTTKFEFPTAHLTSLSLEHIDLRKNPKSPIGRNIMYGLFCVPNLQRLEIRGLRSWKTFRGPAPEFMRKTSSVIDLSFPRAYGDIADLEEILQWPIALRSFNYSVACGPGSEFLLRPAETCEFLSCQKASLEVLQIFDEMVPWRYLSTVRTELNDFIRLRRIALPLLFLVEAGPDEINEAMVPEMSQVLSFHKIFPRSLVQLELQLHQHFTWYEEELSARWGFSWGDADADFLALTPEELIAQKESTSERRLTAAAEKLVKWLLEMVQQKQDRLPQLAGVALLNSFHYTAHNSRIGIYNPEDLGSDIKCLEMLSIFRDSGIALDYIEPRLNQAAAPLLRLRQRPEDLLRVDL